MGATALPEKVYLWEKFHGDKRALEEAVEAGDVTRYVGADGKSWLRHGYENAGRETGKVEKVRLLGFQKLDKDTRKQLCDAMDKCEFTFPKLGLKSLSQQHNMAIKETGELLALKDVELGEDVLTALNEAEEVVHTFIIINYITVHSR